MNLYFIQINIGGQIFGSVYLDCREEERDMLCAQIERQLHKLSDDEFWEWISTNPKIGRFLFDQEISI